MDQETLLRELNFGEISPMELVYDSHGPLYCIKPSAFMKFVKSNDQLVDMFTKFLTGPRIN